MLDETTYRFERDIVLRGDEATFSILLRIAHSKQIEDNTGTIEPSDDVDTIPLVATLQFENLQEILKKVHIAQQRVMSVWSDEIFDLLDLSVCMTCLSERSDTTEILKASDVASTGSLTDKDEGIHDPKQPYVYTHRAQWAMLQPFFGCHLVLFSKDAPRFHNKRFINFLFVVDEQKPERSTAALLSSSPERVAQFATDLRRCHEDVQALLSTL